MKNEETITFQSSPIGIAKCKIIRNLENIPIDFSFIEVNASLWSLFNLKAFDLSGQPISNFPPLAEDQKGWMELFSRAAADNIKVESSKYIATVKKWLKVFVWPGKADELFLGLIDITLEKEHEQAIISKSRERISSFINALPDLILIVDRAGKITEYNSVNAELIYTPGHNSPLRHISQVIPEELQATVIEKIKASLDQNETIQTVLSMHGNESEMQFEARFVPSGINEVLLIIKDISGQSALLHELERRDTLLQAVADASQALLANPEIDQAVDKALSVIGTATKQDRVYVFEVHTDPESNLPLMSQRYEWTNKNVKAQIDNPDLQNIPMLEIAPRWHETLLTGGNIMGNVKDFPDTEKGPLEAQDIVSLLVVPIQTEGQLWGFTGFDDCSNYAKWQMHDVAILRSLASSIGNAIIRDRGKKMLMQAKQMIEEREERYKHVMENLTDAFGIIRADGTFGGFSNAIEKITGYTTAELGAKKLKEIVHPQDYDQTMKVFQATFEKPDNTYEHQLRIIHKTDEWVDVEAKGKNLSEKNSIKGLLVSIRQITDRKKAEESIRKSEEKYRMVAENTSDGILVLDGNNQMLWTSPAYLKQLGFTKENAPEFNETYIYSNIHPEDRDQIFSMVFQAIAEKKESLSYSYRAKHAQGHYIWLEDKTHFVYDEDQNLISSNIISRDITDRKIVTEQLIESENKFRAITETANDAIIVADKEETIIFCNPAFEQTFGYSREAIIGQKISVLLPQAQRNKHHNSFTEFYKNKTFHPGKIIESQAKHKSGHLFPIEISLSWWSSGGNQYTSAQLRDISQRKMAEQSINLLTKAVTQSPVSIIITNAGGEIEYVNPKFCEVSGYSMEEVLGKNPKILKSSGTEDHVYKELWSTITAGNVWSGEMENQRKDGTRFWESVSISPITDAEGKITHYIAVKEDITQGKQLMQSLIRAKEQAEASDRLKTAFMNNISHEIRTPLNHILGFSNMLIDPEIDQEEKKDFFSIIKKGSDRLLDTVSNYMDIALIASGNMKVYPVDVNLMEILNKIQLKFTEACKEKNLTFNINADSSVEAHPIYTDPEMLFKILSHLIDNAVKFTGKGIITIDCTVNPSYVETKIKDTGIGIEESKIPFILSPFGQAEITNTRNHEGSGLGLTIAQKLTALLGGELILNSVFGQGTTVTVGLPLIHGQIPDKNQTHFSKPSIPTLLIVEDHPESRQYMKALFSKTNYHLLIANSAEEAIQTVENDPSISLVIMDIRLPKMDGLSATKHLKTIRAGLPIIAVTANALSGDKEKALAAGCSDYLSKPIDRNELINKIRELL